MAVVQISRIQIRRGQENSGTGLPQLASGEMAWALDTQALYIGNGSVSEGAPAVGNTKILTSNDLTTQGNLLNLLQHTYENGNPAIITGSDANNPISRSIQARLDDRVTSRDFGTLGDGTQDDTIALQRAIDQLFLNNSNKASAVDLSGNSTSSAVASRTTLVLEPGIYLISRTLNIPSYATIIGAGADKTVLKYNPSISVTATTTSLSYTVTCTSATSDMIGAAISGTNIPTSTTITAVTPGVSFTISQTATGTGIVTLSLLLTGPCIQFINDNSTIGNYLVGASDGVYQPKRIVLSNISVHSMTGTNTCIQMCSVKDSLFENLILNGESNSTVVSACVGITMQSNSSIVTCEHNVFRNITLQNLTYGVYASADIRDNSFENCYLRDSYQGFNLGTGVVSPSYGPRQTSIFRTTFQNIKRHAVYLEYGSSNTISNCVLTNVGNDTGSNLSAHYPQIFFATIGNSAVNIQSDRHSDLALTNLSTPYVPEITGHAYYQSSGINQISTAVNPAVGLLFRLPCPTDKDGNPIGSATYQVNYMYQSNTGYTRKGTLTISANIAYTKLQLSDDYVFAGNDTSDTNAQLLDFSAQFLNQTGNVLVSGTPYSVAINYISSLGSDSGTFYYSYIITQ
jgi:hypothetical protein